MAVYAPTGQQLSRPWSELPKSISWQPGPHVPVPGPVRDLDMRVQQPLGRVGQLPQVRRPTPRPAPGQPLPSIRFAL